MFIFERERNQRTVRHLQNNSFVVGMRVRASCIRMCTHEKKTLHVQLHVQIARCTYKLVVQKMGCTYNLYVQAPRTKKPDNATLRAVILKNFRQECIPQLFATFEPLIRHLRRVTSAKGS